MKAEGRKKWAQRGLAAALTLLVLAVLIVDLVYVLIDPRIKLD